MIAPGITPPQAEVDGDELVLTYRGVSDDPVEQRRALDDQVTTIERMLSYLRDALSRR